jgi:hypothetical protein
MDLLSIRNPDTIQLMVCWGTVQRIDPKVLQVTEKVFLILNFFCQAVSLNNVARIVLKTRKRIS